MLEGKIIVFVSFPIISLGLKVQLESKGFTQVELAYSVAHLMESARLSPASLLLMDGDTMKEADLVAIGQFLEHAQAETPIIFFSKDPQKALKDKQQFRWLDSYPWLPMPCHEEQLWQEVNSL